MQKWQKKKTFGGFYEGRGGGGVGKGVKKAFGSRTVRKIGGGGGEKNDLRMRRTSQLELMETRI